VKGVLRSQKGGSCCSLLNQKLGETKINDSNQFYSEPGLKMTVSISNPHLRTAQGMKGFYRNKRGTVNRKVVKDRL
jgi:hypothetical protein